MLGSAERESRQRSGGPRAYTLVGSGAALFVLISKWGCGDTNTPLVRRLPRAQPAFAHLRLDCEDGRGVLREALIVCTAHEVGAHGAATGPVGRRRWGRMVESSAGWARWAGGWARG